MFGRLAMYVFGVKLIPKFAVWHSTTADYCSSTRGGGRPITGYFTVELQIEQLINRNTRLVRDVQLKLGVFGLCSYVNHRREFI